MRILIISAAYPPSAGGVATHVANLVHGLLKLTRDVASITVLTSTQKMHANRYPDRGRLQVLKLRSQEVPNFFGRRVPLEEATALAMDEWRRIDADLVHAHDFDSAYIGWMLRVAFNLPLVLTVHRAPVPWRKDIFKEEPKECFLETVKAYELAERLVVPSDVSVQVLKQQGFLSEQITKIRHGIGYKYLSSFTNLERVVNDLNLDSATDLILCPIRADDNKDPDVFVRAAAIIKEKNPKKKFLFLMTDKPEPDGLFANLPGSAAHLGLEVGIEIVFKSFAHNEMPTLYRRAKVCVVPSPRESFGQTVLEASVYRTPVVAANAAGLAEIVTHNQNGLLFTPHKPEDLAKQVQRILDDDELAEVLWKNALREVEKKYNSERMARQYYELYQSVLSA